MRFRKTILPPLIPLVVIVIVAELVVREGIVKSYLLPTPTAVLRAMVQDRAELGMAMLKTSAAAFLGFVGSTVAGDCVRGGAFLFEDDSESVLPLCSVLSDGADYCDRAFIGDLVWVRDADGDRVGICGFDFSGDR